MADTAPNIRSSAAMMDLLLPLPLSHPSISNLLSLQPLAHPSSLSHSIIVKFLNRVNTAVLGREGEREAKNASAIVGRLVEDDQEGWVLSEYGKGWTNACLTELASVGKALPAHRLALLVTIILRSPQYPSFEREVVHPIMGKVAVTLTRAFERVSAEDTRDVATISVLLAALYSIIHHSPAPFRASVPTLRPLLQSLIVPSSSNTPMEITEIKELASDCLASLHLTNGKAQIPTSWSSEIKTALGGIGMALNGIVGDGWSEDTYRIVPPSVPSGFVLPMDAVERLPLALAHLNGWAESVLALLRYPTSRPVPVPIAQIVAAGLRCLNLTLDTPTLPYISPQHRASLISSLPTIWEAGLQLIAGVANAVGDHLLPHLSVILDHTVWLAETVPSVMRSTHLQLLRFHSFFLELYPSSIVPVEYPTRLLKLSLGHLSPLLDPKGQAVPTTDIVTNGSGSSSKKGKKRARGAEDGLVGGLEGRDRATLSSEEVDVIVESLKFVPLTHITPLLAPALLTFSIRLHISLYLALPTVSHLLQPPEQESRLQGALTTVLQKAALMTDNEGGTSRGWKSIIMSILEPSGDVFSSLLHPSLPALHRPVPPLASLHYFAPEGDDEKRLRLEMGFTTSSDPIVEADDMEVDNDNEPIPIPQTRGTIARPNVSVFMEDSASPITGGTTKTGPAPLTSDLTLHSIDPIEVIPHANITAPIAAAKPQMTDGIAPLPRIPSEHGMGQAAIHAPLQAGSLIGHPAMKGDGTKRPRSDSTGEDDMSKGNEEGEENVKAKAVVPEQALTGGDDEDEPLPEMDSDMDLSDADEDEEDE